MASQPENRGGLIGQLRDHALRGSDEGLWNELQEQKSILSRSVSLRGEINDSVRVELIAKRVRQLGNSGLRTFYILRGTHTQSDLTLEMLPRNVLDVLRRQRVNAGESEEESEGLILRINEDDEVDEREFDGYEDMQFRHVRSVQYLLDGRGSLQNCAREDFYEDDDEGGVDIVGLRTTQAGSLKDEEALILRLEGWGEKPIEHYPLEFVKHPDLKKLERKNSLRELRDDISFFDIVERYSLDKKLLKVTQAEHQTSMFALLAFLNMEASAKVVQDLL